MHYAKRTQKIKQAAQVFQSWKVRGDLPRPETRLSSWVARFAGVQGAYARFEAEWWSNAGSRGKPVFQTLKGKPVAADATVRELCAGFLNHAKGTLAPANYTHYRIVVLEFLMKLYGDISVDADGKLDGIQIKRRETKQTRREHQERIEERKATRRRKSKKSNNDTDMDI